MSPVELAVNAALSRGGTLDIADVGGEDAILRERDDLVRSRIFGSIVDVLGHSATQLARSIELDSMIAEGIAVNIHRLAVLQAIDAITQYARLQSRTIVLALDDRARDVRSDPIFRADAANGIVRLALCDGRWRGFASAVLQRLEQLEDPLAAPMISRLAAAAWDHFRDPFIVTLLERESDNHYAAAQASFERGMIGFVQALEESDLVSIARGLQVARRWLNRACRIENRPDARAYSALSHALSRVAIGAEIAKDSVRVLRETFLERAMFHSAAPGAEWLFPPEGAEMQFVPLVDNLAIWSTGLRDPAGRDIPYLLFGAAKAYCVTRSVRPCGLELGNVVRPAIEARFLESEALLFNLETWLERDADGQLEGDQIARLRSSVQDERKRRTDRGKGDGKSLSRRSDFPSGLGAELDSVGVAAFRAVEDATIWIPLGLTLQENAIVDRVRAQLADEPVYSGEVKLRFDWFLAILTHFLSTRIDATGASIPYLRRLNEGEARPGEAALQRDLRAFLTAYAHVQIEISDVGSGRADIYLPQYGALPFFRFVIEVKRVETQWSNAAIHNFLDQTVAYQQTDVRLGFLAVLDLSKRQPGFPHLTDCLYADATRCGTDIRRAVVIRVPGNKFSPSHKPRGQANATDAMERN